MIFQIVIVIIILIRCSITSDLSKSMYENDSWNDTKQKWPAEFYINGKNQNSSFANEFNVDKKLATLCDKIGNLPQHTANHEIPNQQKIKKKSQYRGVHWIAQLEKWGVRLYIKEANRKYGGVFKDELDAGKRANQICEELGIPLLNPEINAIPSEQNQRNEKTSQYKGVSYKKQTSKWIARFHSKGQIRKYGGQFKDELDAARKVNQLCEEFGTPPHNPLLSAIPNEKYKVPKKEKTSQYKGVSYDKRTGKWCAWFHLKRQKATYGGVFEDELNAANKVNELCKDFGIPPYNPTICAITNQQYQKKEKTSQYKGVTWREATRKWSVLMSWKGGNKEYGGVFTNELDAAKRVNQLCEKFGIPLQNPAISAKLNQKFEKIKKKSQYKGIHWNARLEKWGVRLYNVMKEQKRKYGGMFKDELDAAKRANKICEELGIPLLNPELNAIPNEQYQTHDKKASQYKGVSYKKHTGKWYATLNVKGKTTKYGGQFNDELDAAKSVNRLCKEFGIFPQNPGISGILHEDYQKQKRKSQYKSVYWHKDTGTWFVLMSLKKNKRKYGGLFNDELDAGKRVNQLCEEMGIPPKNPAINAIPDQQYQVILCNDDALRAEFSSLRNILDKNNDPIASTMTKDLLEVINDREQAIMTQINLCIKDGESALSIAAKHGLSNAVKFLISKGADKNHFTNEHHTPLSLAVSNNHLNVVQVLFEDWISPNSHEKPYLHLLPIFNVKSREIAQLLIDNDAVTRDIYNDKHQSPLTVACQNGYLDVVEFFLDDGLDINHLDNDNKTPLFYALINKHHDIANLLNAKGAQSIYNFKSYTKM